MVFLAGLLFHRCQSRTTRNIRFQSVAADALRRKDNNAEIQSCLKFSYKLGGNGEGSDHLGTPSGLIFILYLMPSRVISISAAPIPQPPPSTVAPCAMTTFSSQSRLLYRVSGSP